MKPRAASQLFSLLSLCLVLSVNSLPLNVAQTGQRTAALPLLLLLSYPQLSSGGGILPGIPLRRPQDELTVTTAKPNQLADELPQSEQDDTANALIREQFIQGILQGLQSMPNGSGNPAVLADLLQQLNAASSTAAPKITPPPTVEKDAQVIDEHDDDYDYIDFKNGSRIKYDLDGGQQTPEAAVYPTKILTDPQFGGYFGSQQHVI